LVLLEPFTRALRWYNSDGALLATTRLPIESREITEEDMEIFWKKRFETLWEDEQQGEPDSTIIANSVDNYMLRHRDQIAIHGPVAVGMMCAGGREVWLQEFSTSDNPLGLGNRWLVHSPETGDRVYVQFPEGFRPLRIVDGRAFGVSTTSQGVEVVAYVSLPEQIVPPPAAAEH
jgi:hypothetical protein